MNEAGCGLRVRGPTAEVENDLRAEAVGPRYDGGMVRTHQSSLRFKPARVSPGLRAATERYFPCPRANYRTQVCFKLCEPVDGIGDCGRVAGHAQLSRIQLAILEHLQRSA